MLPYVPKVEARRQDLEEPEASGLQELVATIRSTTDVEYSFCDDNSDSDNKIMTEFRLKFNFDSI